MADAINDFWAADFLWDKLFDSRQYRIPTMVDCHAREALTKVARASFRAYQIVDELDQIVRSLCKPQRIRCDNGPEFAGRRLDQEDYLNKV